MALTKAIGEEHDLPVETMELVHDLPFFMHDRPILVLYGHHPRQQDLLNRESAQQKKFGRETTRVVVQI